MFSRSFAVKGQVGCLQECLNDNIKGILPFSATTDSLFVAVLNYVIEQTPTTTIAIYILVSVSYNTFLLRRYTVRYGS